MSWWFWSIWFHASTCTYAQVSCPATKSAGPVHCAHFCRTLSPTVPTLQPCHLLKSHYAEVASSSSRLERTRVKQGYSSACVWPWVQLTILKQTASKQKMRPTWSPRSFMAKPRVSSWPLGCQALASRPAMDLQSYQAIKNSRTTKRWLNMTEAPYFEWQKH